MEFPRKIGRMYGKWVKIKIIPKTTSLIHLYKELSVWWTLRLMWCTLEGYRSVEATYHCDEIPDKKHLKAGRVDFGPQFQGHTVEKAWRQAWDIASRIVSAAKKQGWALALNSLLPFIQSEPLVQGGSSYLSLTLPGNTLLGMPKGMFPLCFLFSQVDGEHLLSWESW